ncbi:MAG: hypothetical protein OXB95_10905, partial [Rhodobacteraceae bacterium]|nr:hypothetical protein [Paracoccaceae bacterium]
MANQPSPYNPASPGEWFEELNPDRSEGRPGQIGLRRNNAIAIDQSGGGGDEFGSAGKCIAGEAA